ncbi:unnamed protein product, partial [Urochloa humidicola]
GTWPPVSLLQPRKTAHPCSNASNSDDEIGRTRPAVSPARATARALGAAAHAADNELAPLTMDDAA